MNSSPAFVFLNGQLVPAAQAQVSVFDRSFLYGDGLFETLRVFRGEPFRWSEHLARLRAGADFLKLRLPCPADELLAHMRQLIAANQCPEALLRVQVSRGIGRRGYSPRGADQPLLVMTTFPVAGEDAAQPARWRLHTATLRLAAGDPLAAYKTSSKLLQVLARAEAEEHGADEALLLNTSGHVTEGASSNVFWIEGGAIHTPPLPAGALPGVTRGVILELARECGHAIHETAATRDRFAAADGAFLTLSSQGVVEVAALDGVALPASPVTAALREAYRRLTQR